MYNPKDFDDNDGFFNKEPVIERIIERVIERVEKSPEEQAEDERVQARKLAMKPLDNFRGPLAGTQKIFDDADRALKVASKRRARINRQCDELFDEYGLNKSDIHIYASTAEMMDTWFAIDDEDEPEAMLLAASGHTWTEINQELSLGTDVPETAQMSDEEYEKFIDEQEKIEREKAKAALERDSTPE